MRGLYIHFPFCVKKCAYCDFYSLPGRLDLVEPYLNAVLKEAKRHAGLSFQTIYLGGGTPSLLGAQGLSRLIKGLRDILDLSCVSEATLEVNPDSTSQSLLEVARMVGINRISIGIQSLVDLELQKAGRIHTAEQAIQSILMAKKAGFPDISCDVILGLPGQTATSLISTLKKLLDFEIQHLSLYCLSLEPGTPFGIKPPADLPTEDEQADLYLGACTLLQQKGFLHYEISNFALPGYECQHNLNYWRGGEYLGLGPAAATHLEGKRFKNRADLESYLTNPGGFIEDEEILETRQKAAEEAILRLRLLREGLDIGELARRFGDDIIHLLRLRLDDLAEKELLIRTGSTYRLPDQCVLVSNPILARVLEN
ncbi:MAG: radical SAM family heme chaperone HemW [Dehalococcoidales bacterium]|jgi:oxygen-independent coproporphyrinogen-3 oxidase|nr:radical SAM family heme chaperone HemW [Dehalococcoidales bacterium]